MEPNTARICIRIAPPASTSPADQANMFSAAKAKIERMDPTGVRDGWVYQLGDGDPTPEARAKQIAATLTQLSGDEAAAVGSTQASSNVYYEFVGSQVICHFSSGLIRTEQGTDASWGGPQGPNSPIAFALSGCSFPFVVTYSICRIISEEAANV